MHTYLLRYVHADAAASGAGRRRPLRAADSGVRALGSAKWGAGGAEPSIGSTHPRSPIVPPPHGLCSRCHHLLARALSRTGRSRSERCSTHRCASGKPHEALPIDTSIFIYTMVDASTPTVSPAERSSGEPATTNCGVRRVRTSSKSWLIRGCGAREIERPRRSPPAAPPMCVSSIRYSPRTSCAGSTLRDPPKPRCSGRGLRGPGVNRGIDAILATDRAFEKIDGLERIDPSDEKALASLTR